MNFIDIIIVVLLLVGFILGFKDGFVRKIIGLLGFGLAIFLAIFYAANLGKLIESIFGIEFYLSEIIGGFAIFCITIVIFSVIKRIIHPFDKVNNLINQLIGGFIGFIQILFFISAVLYLLNIFNIPDIKNKNSSLLYYDVYAILPKTIDYLKKFTPDSKKLIKEYIKEKDSV
ncbi:MAG: CvpA family protein [Ignavibacteriaceae bacterium]